jgi:MSHA pilin protein MshA
LTLPFAERQWFNRLAVLYKKYSMLKKQRLCSYEVHMQFPRAQAHQGFTLIELISAITIIGIMAALALPKFVDMQKEARVAAVLAAAGNIQSASHTVHAACLAKEGCFNPSGTGVQITIAGVTGSLWAGYPTAGGIGPDSLLITDFVSLNGFSPDIPHGHLAMYKRNDAPDPGNCLVYYWLNDAVPTATAWAVTTGC